MRMRSNRRQAGKIHRKSKVHVSPVMKEAERPA
jgi:hypothetical protein